MIHGPCNIRYFISKTKPCWRFPSVVRWYLSFLLLSFIYVPYGRPWLVQCEYSILHGAVLFEKLTDSYPVKNSLNFMESRRFITVFTIARHLSLSRTISVHSVSLPPSHFLKIHLNIILPSTPGSSKGFFPSGFPHQNPVWTTPLPPPYMLHAQPISFFSVGSPE